MSKSNLHSPKTSDIDAVAKRYAVAITPVMQELIDAGNYDGPIARQFMPDARELVCDGHDLDDPIGDGPHSPVPGIVHRYPDRVLLTPTTVCPVYCRFCFRREVVGPGDDALLNTEQLDDALAYIRENDDIWEVILSGGDPLILSPRRLGSILRRLREIEHVRMIRIHTRVPLVAPERIDDEMLAVMRHAAPLFVVLHANHADEFTASGEQACGQLVDRGIPMLGQTVLLRNINDDADTLEALLRRMVENRIKP
jgi:lysine 2,3-aminomutase